MSVTIKDNTPQVLSDLQIKSNIFLRMASDEVVKTSTPNTPKKTGRMRMDVVKQVLGLKGTIVWGKVYAIYQEVKQFIKYSTPGTGPNFAKNAINSIISKTGDIARKSGLIK